MLGFWSNLLKRHVLRVVDTQKCVDTLCGLLQIFETIGLPPKMLGSCRQTLIVTLQTSCKLPSSFILKQILVLPDSQPLGVGAFASVYRGLYGGNQVAVKRFNLYSRTLRVIKRRFIKETLILQSLHHPNILPFLGVVYSESELSIISPVMKHGNLREYLFSTPSAPKLKLVIQVAHGIHYLKHCNIVHGDLKGLNILIDDYGGVRIADFGLAGYCQNGFMSAPRQPLSSCFSLYWDGSTPLNSKDLASTDSDAGTRRWMSPERLCPLGGEAESARATFASDIFSFAMVIYEIYSGRNPFYKLNNMMAGIAITNGQRPEREFEVPNNLWKLTELCWADSPQQRVRIEQVVHRLSVVYEASEV